MLLNIMIHADLETIIIVSIEIAFSKGKND